MFAEKIPEGRHGDGIRGCLLYEIGASYGVSDAVAYLTASLKEAPAVNFGALQPGILITVPV